MENASKALLIAGAVLIVIVLISLGVMLVRNSGNASDQAKNLSGTIQNSASQGVTQIDTMTGDLFPTTTNTPSGNNTL